MSRFIEKRAAVHKNDSDPAKAGVARLYLAASRQYRKIFGEISLPASDKKIAQKAGAGEALKRKIERANASLMKSAEKLNRNPFNPEAITNFQQAFWQVPRGAEGFTFDIGVCNASSEKLAQPIIDVEGREISPFTVGIPAELKGKTGLIALGKMFPEINSYSVAENTPIEDESDHTGYLKVEGIDTPNLNTDDNQARAHFASQGIFGQRLITYLILSRQMKIIKGQYPDQGSMWSRLLGSRRGGGVVDANCLPVGGVSVSRSLSPQVRHAYLGARSE